MEATNRFEFLSDDEAVLIGLGLTLVIGDALMGVIGGEPWPREEAAKKFPLLVGMMNDLGEKFGVEIDNELSKLAQEALNEMAREEAAKHN